MSETSAQREAAGPWARWGWLMAVVWLVFLFYPGLALVRSEAEELWKILGWIGIVMFALLYVSGFMIGMQAGWRSPPWVVYVFYAGAALSALATVPAIGWNATSFLPFLMAYAAYGISNLWHWIATVVSVLLVATHVFIALRAGESPPWILVGIVLLMAVINSINTFLIGRSVSADRLRMDLATSEQRESIARDVHDLLGHSLTVVKLKAELASRLIDKDPDAARAELAEIVRLTGEAIAGVRGTVTGLRSTPAAGGLAEQLGISRAALESSGVTVVVEGDVQAISPAQSIPSGWILREATTNILRHAAAQRVWITLAPGTVIIEDDGVGMQGEPGNGVRGMTERAASAGASLQIEPGSAAAAKGTRVSLTW